MVADTRMSGGGEICDVFAKKILKVGHHSLLAAVGEFHVLQIVEEVLKDTAQADTQTLVNQLCIFLRSYPKEMDAELVVVGKHADIYVIATVGAYYEPEGEYYATGSGRGPALGYLKGLERGRGGPTTMKDAAQAVVFSSTIDSGVNNRLYGLSLFDHAFDPLA